MSNYEDTSVLRDTLFVLLQDECTDVMSAITMKMDVLIAKFSNQHTLAQILPEVNTRMDNTQP
jgi:hypothetical protein